VRSLMLGGPVDVKRMGQTRKSGKLSRLVSVVGGSSGYGMAFGSKRKKPVSSHPSPTQTKQLLPQKISPMVETENALRPHVYNFLSLSDSKKACTGVIPLS
jgi:hypothetical protein